ncbi:MAG: glycoside hydrolase family 3 C-terminal domain-containing protein [Ignavibacteriales bacterium]|nr:glycoside hydrolase family 3 C-terminal domain-containing protein [Ignavibacteriales bacterium]
MKGKIFLTITLIISLVFVFGFSLKNKLDDEMTYKNKNASIEERVEDLLKRMTLEEKIEMIGGTGFETKAIERLGIPPLNMADGPLGVRWDNSTALPSGILLGATWNPEIVTEFGKVLATETKAKGRHVILAPCVNIARIPMGGRNFESFGEDPFLTSRIAVNYIKGVQNENVVATVKHFAANNQEFQRDFVNTVVDERTLNEIYFPAFKSAVEEANVLAVMCAYNKLNGPYCSENDYLLIDVLKNKWKFNGLVMSDWGAIHTSLPVFNSGMDIEMPTGKYLNSDSLLQKITVGELSESHLNDKVRRILRVMFTIGLFDDYKYDSTKVNTDEHKQIALNIAKEGIVLLKNENSILPLDLNKIKSIAVVGPNSKVAVTGGGGSSMVVPFTSVSPLEALKNKIGDKVKINFAQGMIIDGETNPIETKYLFTDKDEKVNGLKAEYFTNMNLESEPVKVIVDNQINFMWNDKGPFEDFQKDNFSVRWTGYVKAEKSANFTFDVASDDGVRLYIDDQLVINDWNDHAMLTNSYSKELKAGKLYKIKLEYYEKGGGAIVKFGWRKPNDELIVDAINVAKNSDVTIIFAGTNANYESEGFDRKNLTLPNEQDEFIKRITEVNKNTLVVLTTGSPVLMDKWLDNVSGLIEDGSLVNKLEMQLRKFYLAKLILQANYR